MHTSLRQCCRPPQAAGVVSAAPVRYKTDDRVENNIVTAAQVAMLGKRIPDCLVLVSSAAGHAICKLAVVIHTCA